MVESHEGKPCRLFDQAIYTYLISCRVESNFRIGLLNQASQSDSSSRVQLLNLIRHFSKKIPTRLDPTRSVYCSQQDRSRFSLKESFSASRKRSFRAAEEKKVMSEVDVTINSESRIQNSRLSLDEWENYIIKCVCEFEDDDGDTVFCD